MQGFQKNEHLLGVTFAEMKATAVPQCTKVIRTVIFFCARGLQINKKGSAQDVSNRFSKESTYLFYGHRRY